MVLSYGLTIEFTEIIWKATVKRAFPTKSGYMQFMVSIHIYPCMYVCMYLYMTSVPTINQTNRYILYLLNTDEINYTIKNVY